MSSNLRTLQNKLEELKSNTTIDEHSRINLQGIFMILTPRYFIVNLQKEIENAIGIERAADVMYKAAFESAYRYCEESANNLESGGIEIIGKYPESLSMRGWGSFEILRLDEFEDENRIRLRNSAFGEEYGKIGRTVCYCWSGALAGSIQWDLDAKRIPKRVTGNEVTCISKNDKYCEFVIRSKKTSGHTAVQCGPSKMKE